MSAMPGTKNKKLPQSNVALYLSNAIDVSGKTQRQIAEEVGYNRPNIISMLKTGEVDLPLNKVELFAASLELDPLYLLSLVMRERHPEMYRIIWSRVGDRVVSNSERNLLEQVRNMTGSTDVEAVTPEEIAALRNFCDLVAKRKGSIAAKEVGDSQESQ